MVALRLWNVLLLKLLSVVSADAFKKQLKAYLFKLAVTLLSEVPIIFLP